jgi:hypothetical protein
VLAVCLFDNVQHTTSCQQVRCLVQNPALTLGRNGHSSEVRSIDAQPLTRHQFCKDLKRSKQSMMFYFVLAPSHIPLGPRNQLQVHATASENAVKIQVSFLSPTTAGIAFQILELVDIYQHCRIERSSIKGTRCPDLDLHFSPFLANPNQSILVVQGERNENS